jgi:hypothetical protein
VCFRREKKQLAKKQAEVAKLQRQVESERAEANGAMEEIAQLRATAEQMEVSFQAENDVAVGQLQERVAKFKEAKSLQESLLAEERGNLEAAARALVCDQNVPTRSMMDASLAHLIRFAAPQVAEKKAFKKEVKRAKQQGN